VRGGRLQTTLDYFAVLVNIDRASSAVSSVQSSANNTVHEASGRQLSTAALSRSAFAMVAASSRAGMMMATDQQIEVEEAFLFIPKIPMAITGDRSGERAALREAGTIPCVISNLSNRGGIAADAHRPPP